MLPTEAFAEAVAFLPLYDLNSLLVANSLCSSFALKAPTALRWEEFPGLGFYVANRWIYISRLPSSEEEDGEHHRRPVARLNFSSEDETAAFIDAAFPNCVFEDLSVHPYSYLSKQVADAVDRVANSVIIKGVLQPPYNTSHQNTANLARKFRKVKAILLNKELSDDEAHELAKLYRESGAQELHYFSFYDGTRETLALF